MKTYDIAFIGLGASALFATAFLDKKLKVAFIEKLNKIAPKLIISGGGKCNFTNKNLNPNNYIGNKEFIETILREFSNRDLIKFLKRHNLDMELRESGKYFCKQSSKQIIDIFFAYLKKFEVFLNHEVLNIEYKNGIYNIKSNNEDFTAKKVVLCSGGMSFKSLGATDIGYRVAESFGHTITRLSPALVGFTLQKEQFWMKNLSGISLKVSVKIGKKVIFGDMLFAHRGISGPAILNSSLYWEKGLIEVDFLPDFSLEKVFKKGEKRFISSVLSLPKRFVKEFLNSVKVEDKPVYKLNSKEMKRVSLLKSYSFAPAGNFGYTKAEVTKGGVRVDEVEPTTLESRLQKDLYILGEVLDVTGELGGYNIQFAFSSSYIFATKVADNI